MAFTEKKFAGLSKDNKIKKVVFSIREYLVDVESEIYVARLLDWLNKFENMQLPKPRNRQEWGILSNHLLQFLHEENPFLEKVPFDNPGNERNVIPLKLLLDNFRSPFNVGSLMRTAEALGVEELILTGITPTPEHNSKVAKTSKEAEIPHIHIEDAQNYLKDIKSKGYKVYAIEKTSNSKPVKKFNFEFPLLFIVGNEEFGISKELLALSDEIIHIPMLGKKNSLNVSVAAGIVLYQAVSTYFDKY